MKKILSALVLVIVAGIFFCGQHKIEAADIWIYTDRSNAEYYLRECSLPARSWSFAHVIKVRGKNVMHLAYKFVMFTYSGDVDYSVYEGSEPYDIVGGPYNPNPIIEEGTISDSPVAYKIWHNYLKQMEKERWAQIKANERGNRW